MPALDEIVKVDLAVAHRSRPYLDVGDLGARPPIAFQKCLAYAKIFRCLLRCEEFLDHNSIPSLLSGYSISVVGVCLSTDLVDVYVYQVEAYLLSEIVIHFVLFVGEGVHNVIVLFSQFSQVGIAHEDLIQPNTFQGFQIAQAR